MPSLDITKPTGPVPTSGFEAEGTIDPAMGVWIAGDIINGSGVMCGRVLKHDNTWKVTFPPLPGGTLVAGSGQTLRVECLNFDLEDSIGLSVVAETVSTARADKASGGTINLAYPASDGQVFGAPIAWAMGTMNPATEPLYAKLFNPADPALPQLGQIFHVAGTWVAVFLFVKKGDNQILRVRFKNPMLSGKATRIVHVRY